MPRILRNLKIMEVSGVDRGAGEGVKVMLMKRHDDDPVDKVWKTNADLPDAVKGALPDEAQSVFRRVANDRLGAGQSDESAIKQAWTAVKNGWSKQGDKWVRKDGVEKVAAALLKAIQADDDVIDLGKVREAVGNKEIDMTEAELSKMIADAVAKAVPDAVAKLMEKNVQSESSGTLHSGGGKKGKEDAMPKGKVGAAAHSDAGEEEGENDEKVPSEKAFTLPADIEKRLADAESDRKILKQLQDEREAASFAKRAKSIGLSEADGAVMRKAYNGDTEAQAELDKRIEQINKRADEFARTGRIFKEFGSAQAGAVTAYDELAAKAAELKKVDPKLSEAQAFDKAMSDPANRDLVARESNERMAKINRTHAA